MKSQKSNLTLTIGWLYPELMNTYGDRGNITILSKRCEWRGINAEIKHFDPGFSKDQLKKCDLLLMGGAQDKQQEIVNIDLKRIKTVLSKMIEDGVPGLYVCGGFQFLGKYYKEADGKVIEGLGIFDLYTENPGQNSPRLIGNIAVKLNDLELKGSGKNKIHNSRFMIHDSVVVGFENHGGRTYLGRKVKPLGKVIKGFGNNGKDGFEGAIYKNSFGTYLHGPILPKNPHFSDALLNLALKRKYKKFDLDILDDILDNQAHTAIAKRLQVEI